MYTQELGRPGEAEGTALGYEKEVLVGAEERLRVGEGVYVCAGAGVKVCPGVGVKGIMGVLRKAWSSKLKALSGESGRSEVAGLEGPRGGEVGVRGRGHEGSSSPPGSPCCCPPSLPLMLVANSLHTELI